MSDNYTATCTVPPEGWACTRGAGHEGPCAAIPVIQRGMGNERVPEGYLRYKSKKTYTWAAQMAAELLSLRAAHASLPADWHADSSLETWFPLSAARLAELERENAQILAEALEWKLRAEAAETRNGVQRGFQRRHEAPGNGKRNGMSDEQQMYIFPNLAAKPPKLIDDTVRAELVLAGVLNPDGKGEPGNYLEAESIRNRGGEVPTAIFAAKHRWVFTRHWNYYAARGPGIPPQIAEDFHRLWGKQVRVEGHCGCPSPTEYCAGFAVGSYHIDTQAGLNAFVQLLASIIIRKSTEVNRA